MRLGFLLEADAQAKADDIHKRMIASDPSYEKSVLSGQTKQWAIPYQDRDIITKLPVGLFYVDCAERCLFILTPAEILALVAL